MGICVASRHLGVKDNQQNATKMQTSLAIRLIYAEEKLKVLSSMFFNYVGRELSRKQKHYVEVKMMLLSRGRFFGSYNKNLFLI